MLKGESNMKKKLGAVLFLVCSIVNIVLAFAFRTNLTETMKFVMAVLGLVAVVGAVMEVVGRIKDGLLGGICIAGGLLVLSLLMDRILKKESMGGGDIKLVFVTGLYLGAVNGLFSLVLACVIGLMFVVVLKKDKIPFGPSISIAAYLGLTIVPYIVIWYVGLLK